MRDETDRPMPDEFCHHGMCIPSHMIGGIQRYVRNGIPPGSFLSAVINNDLQAACGNADIENERILPAYVAYLYNHAPIGSWGYPDAIQVWRETMATNKNEVKSG